MNNMKKGITLISLIITIVVILILASITVFSSLNTIDESQELKKEVEFESVCTFVRSISSKAEADLIQLNLTSATLITDTTKLNEFLTSSGELSAEEIQKINTDNDRYRQENTPQYGYHYIEGKYIENDNIPGLENVSSIDRSLSTPNKVENNYIINFYTGTVIAKVSESNTLVRGKILGDG